MDTPLWTLDLTALEAGYHLDETRKAYVCLCCGKLYPQQEAFPVDGRLLLAEAAVAQHVAQAHGGMLDCLLSLDKKLLALTENQRQLLRLLSQGKSDAAIAAALDLSASTVRHQRFTFREKAKQAKLYLAAYELAMQGAKPDRDFVDIGAGEAAGDDRSLITQEEERRALHSAFVSLEPLKMRSFQIKEKAKLVALRRISAQFETGRRYTEKEVNDILREIYDDYVTLRRYLIQYGFMARTKDCREYWRL